MIEVKKTRLCKQKYEKTAVISQDRNAPINQDLRYALLYQHVWLLANKLKLAKGEWI